MKTLIYTAQELQELFLKQKWKFCFIGGLALQRWGQPRLTQDVDVTLLTGFGDEEKYINMLLLNYSSRIPNAVEFALKNRVLLLKSESKVGIDIALAGLPYEEEVVKRSTMFEYLPAVNLKTCSAEDLIVLKAFAGRTQDWADIESIIAKQKIHLCNSYIIKHLEPLCDLKETPETLRRVRQLLNIKRK